MLVCILLLFGDRVADFLMSLLSDGPIPDDSPNLEDASSKLQCENYDIIQ